MIHLPGLLASGITVESVQIANRVCLHITETEAAKETTETPAAETSATAVKEEAKKEAEPVEDGQLEHKGSNFPKYATRCLKNTVPATSPRLLIIVQELHLLQEVLLVRLRAR